MFARLTDFPWWQSVGWTMIHFLWIGVLMGFVALTGRLFLRKCRPQVRYLFLTGCLLLMAAAPWPVLWHLLGTLPPMSVNEVTASELTMIPLAESFNLGPRVLSVDEAPAQSLPEVDRTEEVTRWHWKEWLDKAAVVAPWIWLIGTPLTLLFVCCGFAGTRQLRRSSRIMTEQWVLDLSARLHRSLNLGRQVIIAVSDKVVSPILIGVLKPMILLPPSLLTGCTQEQMEMVLLHELAHVRRWDAVVNLTQRIIECVLFFHPLVWVVSHWVRAERETCCDDMVLQQTGEPDVYAETLAFLATSHPDRSPVSALAMARHLLVHRIRRILGTVDHTLRFSPLLLFCITMLLLFGLAIAVGVNQDSEDLGTNNHDRFTHEAISENQSLPTVQLAHGGAVKLHAFVRPTDPAGTWWSPDGRRVPGQKGPDGWDRYRKNWRESPLIAVFEAIHPNTAAPSATIGPAGESWKIPLYFAEGLSPINGRQDYQITIGLGAGPWTTMAELREGESFQKGPFFGKVIGLEQVSPVDHNFPISGATGAIKIDFEFSTLPELDVAFVAVDKQGMQKTVLYTYGPQDSYWKNRQIHHEPVVHGMDKNMFDHILIRSRPRHWATFHFAADFSQAVPTFRVLQAEAMEIREEQTSQVELELNNDSETVSIQLVPEKPRWQLGERPVIRVIIRNEGSPDVSIPTSEASLEVEWDGSWYIWTGPKQTAATPATSANEPEGIRVRLERSHWGIWIEHTKPPQPLSVTYGIHTLRIAAYLTDPNGESKHKAISDPIEIEIHDDAGIGFVPQ